MNQRVFPDHRKVFGKEYCREDGDDLEDEILGEEAPDLVDYTLTNTGNLKLTIFSMSQKMYNAIFFLQTFF